MHPEDTVTWQPEATTRRDVRRVRGDSEPPPTERRGNGARPRAAKERVTADLTRDERYEK